MGPNQAFPQRTYPVDGADSHLFATCNPSNFIRLRSTIGVTAHPGGRQKCIPPLEPALSVTSKAVQASKKDDVGGV